MKATYGKCHLPLSSLTKNKQMRTWKLSKVEVIKDKLLEIKVDREPTLNLHVQKLCKKTDRKLHTFVRGTPYMSITQYDLTQ